jgi:hypothetical protein
MRKTGKRISKSVQIALLASAFSNAQAAPETQPYEINKGDTLSQIAQALYGNWIKFKELYELNKDRIANPNLIFPGQRLRLIDGEEIELVEGAAGAAQNRQAKSEGLMDEGGGDLVADNSAGLPVRRSRGKQGRRGRSAEWQLLPTQRWERFVFRVPPQIDPQGFDRRSRVGIKYKDSLNIPSTLVSDRLAVLGAITGGRNEYSAFGLGEQVLIRAEEELQVGQTYSLTHEPERIQSNRDSRVGYLYRLTGKIRIVGVRDGVFVGTITQAYEPVMREDLLVAEVPQVRLVEAIAAPSALAASIIEDESSLSQNLGGHRMIFLDVGTEDGVKSGMVFRRYQHEDPLTGKTLSAQDFLVEGEVKVLTAGDRFSIAIVLNNRSPMHRDDELVAVVDVSDLGKHMGLQSDLQDHRPGNLDELDQMDATQGLGEQEDRDLRQLENANSANSTDDIQKVEVNSTPRTVIEIGKEKGPNDHSGAAGSTNHAAPPVPGEAPATDQQLNAPTDTPVPDDSTPGAEPGSDQAVPPTDEAPRPTTAPDPGTAPDPSQTPPPPSDPFATDSFQGEVQPAPSTDGQPNPQADPLLDAIPGN